MKYGLTNFYSHFVWAYFGQVSAKHTIVEPIEEEEQRTIHPVMRICGENEVETHDCSHHKAVAGNAHAIGNFMKKVKPFIDQSWGCTTERFLQRLSHNNPTEDCEQDPGENEPVP